MEFTAQSLASRLVDLNLVEQHRVEQLWSEMRTSENELEDFKTLALRKELVTNFQLDRLMTGERLGFFYGPYKVLYLIGAGTFARVFRAVHTKTGKVVAVKVLRRRHRDQVIQVEQFLREGQMGLKLKHTNIVAITDIVNDPRTPYLVMEFVEGDTLRQVLKIRGKFSAYDGLKVMRDLCNGLQFASSMGVTHRDLKLSNVLVTFEGRCKLVDFGLAAMADTSSNEAIADCPSARAIDYAALERGTGVRKGDARSDIFFLGGIMYNILADVPPMSETRDRMARLNISRLKDIPPLGSLVSDLPPAVLMICSKALEFDPTKRYQTPTEMLRDIEKAMALIEKGGEATVEAIETAKIQEAELTREGEGKTIMFIENRPELQNLLREKLKSRGYRVLIFSDVQRAKSRFENMDDEMPADCVIVSAINLGNEALEFYNDLGDHEQTKDMPALLLADQRQSHILQRAKLGPHRQIIAMPLKVRDLRESLMKLLDLEAIPKGD